MHALSRQERTMGYFILAHHLDLLGFALLLLALMAFVHRWLRRSAGNPGFSVKAWTAMGGIIAAGVLLALASGEAETQRMQRMISGLAPTYADEMARGGLARINEHTPADDPTYLALIHDQIRWEKDNPTIADIYTMTRRADGKFIFLVDSETDYNHNGVIDEEREKRTPIGEVYEEDHDLLEQTISGTAVFTPTPTTDRWGTWISTYVPVFDEHGRPFAVLGVDFDAREYVHAILWRRGAMLLLAGMIGIILISSLGVLATLRGEMAKRDHLHQQLVEASRMAGMAEIASGVLHNVGDALTSVNASAASLYENLRSGHIDELLQAAKLLKNNQYDLPGFLTGDEAGRHILADLAALGTTFQEQQRSLQKDMADLFRGVDNIKEIVRSHQQIAKTPALSGDVLPAAVFEQAAALSFGKQQRATIELVRQFEPLESASLDQRRILQVLVNLLSNAKRAVQGADHPRITLRLGKSADAIKFEVEDNGAGFAPQDVPHIFEQVSNGADGHGLDLRNAAQIAAAMGGRIGVQSDGLGHGARFTLEIPMSGILAQSPARG